MDFYKEKSGPSRELSNPSKMKETVKMKNAWENPDIKREMLEDRVITWSSDSEKRKEDSKTLVNIFDDEQFLSKFGPTATLNSRLPETSVDTKNSYSGHQISPKAENSDFQDSFLPLKIKKEQKVQGGYSNPQNSNPSSFFSPPSQSSTPGMNYNGCDFQFDNERFARSHQRPSYRNGENLAYPFSTSIRDSRFCSPRINNPSQSFGFQYNDEFELKYADSPYFIEEFCQYASFCNDSSPLHNESESSEATVPNIPDLNLRVQDSTFSRNEKYKEENVSHLNYETLDQSSKQLNNHFQDLESFSIQNQGARPKRPNFYPEPYFHESVKLFTEDREEHVASYNQNNNGNQTGFNNTSEAFLQNTPSFDEPLQFDFGRNLATKVEDAQLNANIGNEMPIALTPRATSEIKENAANSFQVLQSPDLPIEPNSPESFRKNTSENLYHSLSPLCTDDIETTLDPATTWTDNTKLRSKLMVVLEKYIPPVNENEFDGQSETGEISEMACDSSKIEGNSHVPRHSDVPKLLRKRKHSTSDTSSMNLQKDPHCSLQMKKDTTYSCCDIPPPKKARKQFQCNYCHKVYVREHFFIKHIQSCGTAKAYKCKDCNKTCATKSALTAHRKSHSSEKYSCDLCDKVYVRIWCFEKHMVRHLVIRVYLCLLCHEAFTDKGERDKHLRRCHGL